jgi:uncharacterized membrane protein
MRGIWLIFLELTVVRLGLFFDPLNAPVILTVLWSIGASFVVLACLVFLPGRVVGALGVLLIATLGLADGICSLSLGLLTADHVRLAPDLRVTFKRR